MSVPTDEVDENVIKQIVSISNENNEKRGVTGALAFNGRAFGQILEGDQHTVSDLMKIIAKDKRHRGLIEVCRIGVPERAFYDWGMSFSEKRNFNDFMELMVEI